MCDTLVALADATSDGSVLLAKNSDREPDEGHEVVLLAAAEHSPGERVRCTYLEIEQVPRTHAVLLSKPYWIWGAEMGANEHGVVIGNEAVFTKAPKEPADGLIGMDLLRLALERAASADEALEMITSLLARHGQGGRCGHTADLRYDNSFLIADPSGAWVLETAGRDWAAERVRSRRSISNAITIGGRPDRCSPTLVPSAVERGWSRSAEEFDFGRDASDFLYTRFSDARARQCRTTDGLAAAAGRLDVASAIGLLRDHGGTEPGFTPAKGLLGQSVCAHAGYGPVRISQSTASWVSHLAPDGTATHWVTATSAPCTSVFKPVWFDGGLPDLGPQPTGTYDPASLWWRHEDLHRATLADYARLHALYRDELLALEAGLRARAAECRTADDRRRCTQEAFAAVDAAEARWTRAVAEASGRRYAPGLFGRAWKGFDRAAGRTPALT
jgi:dipeptidase